MEVSELLAGLDAKMAESEEWIGELRRELVSAEQGLEDMRRAAAAVRSAIQRLSGEGVTPSTPTDTSWRGLTHVDAVEAALREAGHPLHLTEIAAATVNHGHARLTKAKVSATLTHLSQLRGTAVNVGKGRWDYVPKTTLRLVGPSEKLPSRGSSPDPAIPVSGTGSPIA